ncbi:MAG: hypothetical protein K2J49_07650 [Muribaculaceae bacterium]|nr:hypothetical protein [Muribaculaceae bacterium]
MIKRLLLSALSLWAMAPAIAQTWPEISPEMRPGTRWWWLGSAVDSVNLKRSVEEYAATGLGSLEITPIYGVKNNEHNEIGFLSPEWMAMLRTTEEIAGANGILVDMNQGTGWPFGGPEVSQDDGACKAIFLICLL